MTDNMVRTQVYLPRDVHATLTKRAEEHGLTLAVQIRAALDDYLKRVEADEEAPILQPDDPIFKLVGIFEGDDPHVAVDHDHYLYGAPRRSLTAEYRVRESPAPARKRARRKSQAGKPTR